MDKNINSEFLLSSYLYQDTKRKLKAGELGVILANDGIGKTSFLVRLALDELGQGHDVVHIALGQTAEAVHSRYQTLAVDWTQELGEHLVVDAHLDHQISPYRLHEVVENTRRQKACEPALILLDGYDWMTAKVDERKRLKAFKEMAGNQGAPMWLSANTVEHPDTIEHASLPGPMTPYGSLIDMAVLLHSRNDSLEVILLKTFEQTPPAQPVVQLAPNTWRTVSR